MRSGAIFVAMWTALAAGCAGTAPPTGNGDEEPALDALGFGPPIALTSGKTAREPTLRIGSDGTFFLTALRTSKDPETGASSWLLFSRDEGASWSPLPGPVHERLPGNEGDVALDGKGNVYFVDLNPSGLDATFSKWRPGPVWESTRPLQGTLGLDDRPWLAAHGDGIVYAAGNSAAPLPSLGQTTPGSIWFYRSTNGGLTWSTGTAFPRSFLCAISASPADDSTVFAACDTRAGDLPVGGGARSVVAYTSGDRGATWQAHPLATFERGPAPLLPCVAVDGGGRALVAWGDGDGTHEDGTRVFVARGSGGAWDVRDVTPSAGTFQMLACAASAGGRAAVAFYGSPDVVPDDATEWGVHAVVEQEGAWVARVADAGPVARGPGAPADFMGAAFGPDEQLHVVYERGDLAEVANGLARYASDVYLATQSGPGVAEV